MASSDPFDEAPHDKSAPRVPPMRLHHARNLSSDAAAAALFASPGTSPVSTVRRTPDVRDAAPSGRATDPHADTNRCAPHAVVMHRRGLSQDGGSFDLVTALPPRMAGGGGTPSGRNTSCGDDKEDHMLHSIYAPREVCPACKCPRNSSVWCPTTQRHHGTDERIPCTNNNLSTDMISPVSTSRTPAGAGPTTPSALAGNADDEDPFAQSNGSQSPSAADGTPGARKAWSLFKTAEEKQMATVEERERVARRRLRKDGYESELASRERLFEAFKDLRSSIAKVDKLKGRLRQAESEARASLQAEETRSFERIIKEILSLVALARKGESPPPVATTDSA